MFILSESVLIPDHLRWKVVSFPSTLFLGPVLEVLLRDVPTPQREDLRLGLQEALVNAACHGNRLEPELTVQVRYARRGREHWWLIRDQGQDWHCPRPDAESMALPAADACDGRGLFLIREIFERVVWLAESRELALGTTLDHRRWGLRFSLQ